MTHYFVQMKKNQPDRRTYANEVNTSEITDIISLVKHVLKIVGQKFKEAKPPVDYMSIVLEATAIADFF